MNTPSHSDGLPRSHPVASAVPMQPSTAPTEPKKRVSDRMVQIEVSGFDEESGDCRLAIYTKVKGFNDPSQAAAREIAPVRSNTLRWEVPLSKLLQDDETDQLAISAFHDKNENGQLDKNAIGIPTERYGFSNNPKRGFGPPNFRQAAMGIPSGSDEDQRPWVIHIEVR